MPNGGNADHALIECLLRPYKACRFNEQRKSCYDDRFFNKPGRGLLLPKTSLQTPCDCK